MLLNNRKCLIKHRMTYILNPSKLFLNAVLLNILRKILLFLKVEDISESQILPLAEIAYMQIQKVKIHFINDVEWANLESMLKVYYYN